MELYVDIAGAEDVPLPVRSVALDSHRLASKSTAHASPVANISEGDENDQTWVMHDDDDDDENIAMEERLLAKDASASEGDEGGDMGASQILVYHETVESQILQLNYVGSVQLGDHHKEVQMALRHNLMREHQDVIVIESTPAKLSIKCAAYDKGCPWRVRAIKQVFDENWKISRWGGDHNCLNDHISQGHRQLDADIIAELVLDDIVLIDETKDNVNKKLDLWRSTLEYKVFTLSRSKTEYMKCEFSLVKDGDQDPVHLLGQEKGMEKEKQVPSNVGLQSEGSTAIDEALPGCKNTCGNVSIPYPFGIGASTVTGKNCFLEEGLQLRCDNKSTLYDGTRGNVQILNITLQGQMDLLFFVSKVCKIGFDRKETQGNEPYLRTPAYTISSEHNKFVSVGCDTYGYLNSFHDGDKYSTGCLTRCNSIVDMQSDGNCTGIGCCQVDIPPGMKNITLQAFSFNNFNDSSEFNNCSSSFVVKKGYYNFSSSHLEDFPYENVPLVVDWAVGNESNDTCEKSRREPNYACKKNSDCEDSATGYGYRCKCKQGYQGNPFLPDGCRDIEECKNGLHDCISDQNCRETEGSFECFCPDGQFGNGKREGGGCQQKRDAALTKILIGAGAGLMALFVMISWLYLIFQKRKLIKLKEKFFKQNGGIILQQRLSAGENTSQSTTLFTAEQLKKATNNYDESLIIGRGGYGTVYKGVLSDKSIVAIKKSKIVDQSQIEQFINEVIVLSQINHRNVVKLLGCCLETEVPSLVYEFVNNGTLFDYIHNEGKSGNVPWKTRLRIAAEAAGALSYLHSAASIPIIHRDVKTPNILLDDSYTTKVSDFGASRLVPLDQTELATMVQGTIGYLDPEYMQTSQLNEKSDVYSFGVVLIELLTGEKPLCFDRSEEKRSLAMHFLSCLREDRLFEVLQFGILNVENKEEIKEVAILATKCLRLRGEERPSMKEVAMELEGIRLMEKHPWINTDVNLEETHYLLHEASSSIHEHGDSSSHQNSGYDSIKDHVLIDFDDGR
ncbi:wall-associated receptor kinase 2-like [Gastrolobium bilobum]|uniref:wall-associated receptor kinase 2-like n=1 Tax=Gastrolobium bilobum TaxID=150636 RepID=UPI002AB047B9|nr:wall-associated receptor kinase 2-like [Gastrolobium bilobum]